MPFEHMNCFGVSQNNTLPEVFSAISPICNRNNVLANSNFDSKNQEKTGMLRLNIKPTLENIVIDPKPETVANAFGMDLLVANTEKKCPEDLSLCNSKLRTFDIQNDNSQFYIPPVPSTKISRVLVVTCSNVDALRALIQSSFNSADMVVQKLLVNNVGYVLILSWYDLRDIAIHLKFLQDLAPLYQIFDLSFSRIAENSLLSQIICGPKLNYFEDIYDTIYLYVHSQNQSDFNFSNFQNDICFQLSKFGSLYDISMIIEGFVCYKCRFYNIRTPFLMKKIHTVKIRDFKTIIFQTLIETREYVTLHTNSKADWSFCPNTLKHYDILGEEWKKYQFLKHRRLGSIPFNNNEIKNENKINIAKIISGEDQRVTLMIKNIPNKVKHEELKAFIDATNFGDYQFLCMLNDSIFCSLLLQEY